MTTPTVIVMTTTGSCHPPSLLRLLLCGLHAATMIFWPSWSKFTGFSFLYHQLLETSARDWDICWPYCFFSLAAPKLWRKVKKEEFLWNDTIYYLTRRWKLFLVENSQWEECGKSKVCVGHKLLHMEIERLAQYLFKSLSLYSICCQNLVTHSSFIPNWISQDFPNIYSTNTEMVIITHDLFCLSLFGVKLIHGQKKDLELKQKVYLPYCLCLF